MPDILFICSINRFRSVIAAEYFRMLLEKDQPSGEWQVSSAGTWAKEGLAPAQEAVQYAKGNGFDVTQVRSREVDTTMLEQADLIIVMGEGHREAISCEFPGIKEKVYLLSEISEDQTYDIPDLGESADDTAEELGNEICSLLSSGYKNIVLKAQKRERGR